MNPPPQGAAPAPSGICCVKRPRCPTLPALKQQGLHHLPGRSSTVPTTQRSPSSHTILWGHQRPVLTGTELGLNAPRAEQQEVERDNIWFKFFLNSLPTEYFLFSFPRTSFISPCLPLATVSGRNNEFLIGGGGGKKQTLRQEEKTLICLITLISRKPHLREREPREDHTEQGPGPLFSLNPGDAVQVPARVNPAQRSSPSHPTHPWHG